MMIIILIIIILCCPSTYMKSYYFVLVELAEKEGVRDPFEKVALKLCNKDFFVHKLARSFIANELLIMHLAGLWLF